MRKSKTLQRKIWTDPNFIFLNINAFLVVFGYGIAVYTALESVAAMKIVKSFFLAVSCIFLFKDMKLNRNPIPSPTFIYVMIFSFWVFLMSFFSSNIIYAISKSLNFLFPFIYLYIALHNLLNKYPSVELLKAFIKATNIIYLIPVLSYIISGAGFGQVNIYGQGTKEGQFFVSNQYGWSCCIFIITSVDLWLNAKPGKGYRIFLIISSLVALYIMLISGNRASWVSMIFALMIFILRLKNIRTDFKVLLMIIPIAAGIWFYQIPESSLQSRLNDTESQLEKGEARFNTAKLAISEFNDNKILWVTGAGMFNYEEIIHGEGLGDYHNSYLEVLFGGGIILFLLFINFMLLRPIYYYIKYYSKYFLLIPPFVVIPFFESNLTGGQFIFFPWFIFMLLFNIPPYYDEMMKANAQQRAIQNKKIIPA